MLPLCLELHMYRFSHSCGAFRNGGITIFYLFPFAVISRLAVFPQHFPYSKTML